MWLEADAIGQSGGSDGGLYRRYGRGFTGCIVAWKHVAKAGFDLLFSLLIHCPLAVSRIKHLLDLISGGKTQGH